VDVVIDARQHADVTILVLGADLVNGDVSLDLVEALVSTPFLNNLDDARRVVNVAEFEASGTIEGWMIEYTSGSSGTRPAEG
jgi:ribose 5-phosphate isomerase RpiB